MSGLSVFAYIKTRIVDHCGLIDNRHMRTKGEMPTVVGVPVREYPTRLNRGVIENHDDWDCLDDLEEAGVIVNNGTGINRRYKLTPLGESLAGRLRAHLADQRLYKDFYPIISE